MTAAPEPRYRGGCVPGMRVGAPGRPGCRAACAHRRSVEEYRLVRQAWEDRAHAVGADVPGSDEDRDFRALHPAPTFERWLRESAQAAEPDIERVAA